jgi:hypothetical protein
MIKKHYASQKKVLNLLKKYRSVGKVASKLGVAPQLVYNRIRFSRLEEVVQNAVSSEIMSCSAALLLEKLEPEAQKKALRAIKKLHRDKPYKKGRHGGSVTMAEVKEVVSNLKVQK